MRVCLASELSKKVFWRFVFTVQVFGALQRDDSSSHKVRVGDVHPFNIISWFYSFIVSHAHIESDAERRKCHEERDLHP